MPWGFRREDTGQLKRRSFYEGKWKSQGVEGLSSMRKWGFWADVSVKDHSEKEQEKKKKNKRREPTSRS